MKKLEPPSAEAILIHRIQDSRHRDVALQPDFPSLRKSYGAPNTGRAADGGAKLAELTPEPP
jgi:hypothetical protein